MPDDPNQPPKKSGALRDVRQAETIIQLVLAVPAGCFVGLGIGYLLDRHFHTKWIAVTLMLLGAVGGFVQIFTYLSRSGKGRGE
jgi:ATP synthase protein I